MGEFHISTALGVGPTRHVILHFTNMADRTVAAQRLRCRATNRKVTGSIPLEYVRRYTVDVAYVTQQGSTEPQSTCKRRLYDTMRYMCRAGTESKQMRNTNLWPQTA